MLNGVLKTISADEKANIKQQEIKDLAVLQFFSLNFLLCISNIRVFKEPPKYY